MIGRPARAAPAPTLGPSASPYVAGRYATTSAVRGSRFHTAAVLTLKSVWQGEADTVAVVGEYEQPISAFPRVVIPQAAKDLLSDQIQYRGLA